MVLTIRCCGDDPQQCVWCALHTWAWATSGCVSIPKSPRGASQEEVTRSRSRSQPWPWLKPPLGLFFHLLGVGTATLSHAKISPWPRDHQRRLSWYFLRNPTWPAWISLKIDLKLSAHWRAKTILRTSFSQPSKFSPWDGPPFFTPPSFPASYQVTLHLCLSRGNVYFPASAHDLALCLAVTQWMQQMRLWVQACLWAFRDPVHFCSLSCVFMRTWPG